MARATMMFNMNDHFMDNDKRPLIIIGDKTYSVDDSVETTKKFREQWNKDADDREAVYRIAFGEKAAQEIIDMNLRLYNANLLYLTLLGIYKGDSQEEIEGSFRKLDEIYRGEKSEK